MSRPALWASTSSAPSVGSPTTLPSTSLASFAIDVRAGWRRRGCRCCRPAWLIVALEAVADAGDRVAVGRIEHLDGGHLVHRQRAGLVGVDRRGEAERLDRRQVLDDGLLLGQLDAAQRQDHLDDRRAAPSGIAAMASATAVMKSIVHDCPRLEPEGEHDDHRYAGRADDPQRQRVHLLGERRLLRRGAPTACRRSCRPRCRPRRWSRSSRRCRG